MLDVGIIGAGQAGQRIAVALASFPDVRVVAVVDPRTGREILTGDTSAWRIHDLSFYEDDDQFIQHPIDALVVAADPTSMSVQKRLLLETHKIQVPILWERPVGDGSQPPSRLVEQIPSSNQSVVSFARYGLNQSLRDELASIELGDVIDFDVYMTLNCGLRSKPWRHQDGVPLPVHFLDGLQETLSIFGLGECQILSSEKSTRQSDDISYEDKWVVHLGSSRGATGRVVAIQYPSDREHLYALRGIRVAGTRGAITVGQDGVTHWGSDGSMRRLSAIADPRISDATDRLVQFFREVEGYPADVRSAGEARALASCLRAWADSCSGSDAAQLADQGLAAAIQFEPATVSSSDAALDFALQIVDSAH